MLPNRRDCLRHAAGLAAAAACGGARVPALAGDPAGSTAGPPGARKLIVVLFGGGTRCSESIDDPAHRFIPQLGRDLIPLGTLFTNVRVEGRIVHTNCTASALTGHREYDEDNDWSRPPKHPTVFELFRRARQRPDTSAWAFVYASILARVGVSAAAGFGADYAANVVEPPTIPRRVGEEMARLMQEAAMSGSPARELEVIRHCASLSRSAGRVSLSGLRSEEARHFAEGQFAHWQGGAGTTSHDAYLADRAIACMRTFAPDVMAVAFGEIDSAHYGSWSRYVEAIRRTDALTARLWQAVEQLDAYRGRTLMLVMPDHGRELERPGGPGFMHHSDFYVDRDADEGCRRVWMLAVGPGIAAGRTLDRPVPATAAAATGLAFLDVEASPGAAESLLDLGRG